MASEVDICNLALGNIRAASINSLTEQSIQAQQCKLRYGQLRDQLLRAMPWQFAHSVKPLSVLSIEVFQWSYAYSRPTDVLLINRLIRNWDTTDAESSPVYPNNAINNSIHREPVGYEMQNIDGQQVIVSHEADLHIDYQVKVTDPNLFAPDFISAFSWLLSAELAIPLAGIEGGRQLRQDAYSIYQNYLNEAIANNLNEQYHVTPDSEFVTDRW